MRWHPNSRDRASTPGYKIDYIFTDPQTAEGCTACIWEECVNGIYLSDHYPVEAVWEL